MDMLPVDTATVEALSLGGDEFAVLVTNEQTKGDLFAVHLRMPPGGGPPVMHRHEPAEVYYVTEGEFTFYEQGCDGTVRRITAGAGQVMPLAGNTPHTIRNETAADAVAFVVHAPGGPMEGFLRAAVELGANGNSDMGAVLAVAAQNGIELLGPIPATIPR